MQYLKCDECPYVSKFQRRYAAKNLTKHTQAVHSEKKYECSRCNAKFSHRYKVARHACRVRLEKRDAGTVMEKQMSMREANEKDGNKEAGNQEGEDKERGNKGSEHKEMGNKGSEDKEVRNKGSEDKEVSNKGSEDKEVGNKGSEVKEVGNKGSEDKKGRNKGSEDRNKEGTNQNYNLNKNLKDYLPSSPVSRNKGVRGKLRPKRIVEKMYSVSSKSYFEEVSIAYSILRLCLLFILYFQSLPPKNLSFESFKRWSFRHVAKYGQRRRILTHSQRETIKKAKEFSMPDKKESKKNENVNITKKEVTRNDLKCRRNSRSFSKFNRKMMKTENKYAIQNISPRKEDLYTINGSHKILCPPSPGTDIRVNAVKTNMLNTNLFYKRTRQPITCKNQAVVKFFPQLFQ